MVVGVFIKLDTWYIVFNRHYNDSIRMAIIIFYFSTKLESLAFYESLIPCQCLLEPPFAVHIEKTIFMLPTLIDIES